MGGFIYKTKLGDSNNRAGNKVYFCCHPNDFDVYYQCISKEIWNAYENCVICYEDKDVTCEDEKDFEADLLDVSGVLLIITGSFVSDYYTSDVIIYENFRYAKENGIPIIPILVDSAAEEEFNRISGGIHCIYRSSINEIQSYQDKLMVYLDRIFTNSSDREIVLSHFTGSVFLSYRRKDRRLVDNLMKQIHSLPEARDISIWFDEFLEPGEDFNDEIKDRIRACDIFLLCVTPEIIKCKDDGTDNYVYSVEFEEAKSKNKKIIAVEIEKTEIEAFRKKYGNDIEYISKENADMISEVVCNYLKKKGVALEIQSDNRDNHDYYIALGYLYGIGVETDRIRAVKTLEDIADSHVDAAWRLAWVYENSIKEPADYAKAMRLYKKAADLQFDKYREDNTKTNLINWIKLVVTWGDKCLRVDTWRIVYDALRTAIEVCDDYLHIDRDADVLLNEGVLFSRLGDINMNQMADGTVMAIDDYGNYLKLVNEAIDEPNCECTDELRKEKAIALYKLSQSEVRCYETGGDIAHLKKAREYLGVFIDNYKFRMSYLEENGADNVSEILDCMRGIIIATDGIGNTWLNKGTGKKSKEKYEETLRMAEELYEKTQDDRDRHSIGIAYKRIGYVERTNGNYENAVNHILRFKDIEEELYDKTGDSRYEEWISEALLDLALIYIVTRKYDKSKECIYRAKNMRISEYIRAMFTNNLKELLQYCDNMICANDSSYQIWYERKAKIQEILSEI